MKNLVIFVATIMSTGLFAGFINHYQVNVSGNTAYGSFIGARNSADNTQYISCSFVGREPSPYGICSARNTAGDRFYCTTTKDYHLEQIRGLSNESYLYMQKDDAGKCEYIYSATGSMFHE
ncbi:hypothetical protein [Pleionea sediminis]|uniref:hypothetical protein n=1 Tax=Pleionea sediminis TaxID=2569479 RepID=UPI001186A629|nr:hypothetical protein [Pleionea sediminis]